MVSDRKCDLRCGTSRREFYCKLRKWGVREETGIAIECVRFLICVYFEKLISFFFFLFGFKMRWFKMKLKRKYSNVIYANLRYEKLCLKQEKKCDEKYIFLYYIIFWKKKYWNKICSINYIDTFTAFLSSEVGKVGYILKFHRQLNSSIQQRCQFQIPVNATMQRNSENF